MAHSYSQETFLLGTGQPARALGHPDLVVRSLSLLGMGCLNQQSIFPSESLGMVGSGSLLPPGCLPV